MNITRRAVKGADSADSDGQSPYESHWFKPFIAPAYSSGAISLILTLRGEWHCGSVFLGGIFMGVKNRYTVHGLETEILPLPDALYERIVTAQENLKQ